MSLGERLTFGEVHVVIHADAESTRGALGVMEEVPPLADTPCMSTPTRTSSSTRWRAST